MKSTRKKLQFNDLLQGALFVAPVLVFSLLLTSCNPTELQSAGVRTDPNTVNANMISKAYVYTDDPTHATGNKNLPASFNIGSLLGKTAQVITPTSKTSLTNDCLLNQEQYFFGTTSSTFVDCLRVLSSDSPSVIPLQPKSGNWNFTTGSTEFYQVQAMYQANKSIERWLGALGFIHESLHVGGSKSLPPALPYSLSDMGTWWFKYLSSESQMTKSAQLTVYSTVTDDSLKNNAYYEPVANALRLGWTEYPGYKAGSAKSVLMIQDPSILYHEMGHVFMTLFLNTRNAKLVGSTWKPLNYQAFPYYGFYSELGAMGEGIADYFAYAMTGHTTLGAWAFGSFVTGQRPMTEENSLHAPGISSAVDERLSYPDYLLYEPSQPGFPIEDVHNGGMFTSHYLVALTDSLKSECFWDQSTAVNHVMLAMAESFAFLGDLTGKGSDYNNTSKSIVNMHPNASYDWYYSVRQITVRRWAQAMARNIYHFITRDPAGCPNFTKEKSEKLLDMYGLLLFRHYDDNGTFSNSSSNSATRQDSFAMATPLGLFNSTVGGFGSSMFGSFFPEAMSGTKATPTNVDELNRTKSVLVPKAALDFKTTGAYSTIFIDDSQKFGQDILSTILFQGRVISPSTGIAGPEYNNSNNRISPGEIIGIGLDMVNRSNVPISGVTILATPWAHMKVTDAVTGKSQPCSINGFPSLSEGAVTCTDADVLPTDGARFKKPVTGNYPSKALHPVCLVQTTSNNETRWVSQDFYRKNILQLEDKDCLGYGTPDFAPAECLARFMPGKEMAMMAKIDPQKSYIETLTKAYVDHNASVPDEEKYSIPGPSSSSVLILEMNKWIPPGTNFTCRLRAQFSNCSDCFESAAGQDEYTDIEYAGEKPFKVLDLSFIVLE
ncbi:MAG: hypothetical protein K2P81_09525 [Bacteriovoracaceae bacterium]|nr:hypothetical protein [Bacteriovoracaceae bacterium]